MRLHIGFWMVWWFRDPHVLWGTSLVPLAWIVINGCFYWWESPGHLVLVRWCGPMVMVGEISLTLHCWKLWHVCDIVGVLCWEEFGLLLILWWCVFLVSFVMVEIMLWWHLLIGGQWVVDHRWSILGPNWFLAEPPQTMGILELLCSLLDLRGNIEGCIVGFQS